MAIIAWGAAAIYLFNVLQYYLLFVDFLTRNIVFQEQVLGIDVCHPTKFWGQVSLTQFIIH